MQQIVPDVYAIPGLMAGRVYLLKDADGLTLIDTSISPSGKRIVGSVEKAGYKPSDVKRILITHAHPDHVGGLHTVVQATGAEVWASQLEADVMAGKTSIPRPDRSRLHGLYKLLMPPTTWIKLPVQAARILHDGDVLPEVLDGLTVISTPGHAPGHLSFWHPERKLLFTGDVIFHMMGRMTLPFASLTVDMEEDKRSVRKLAALDTETACFGHGPWISSGAAAKIRAFADRVGA